MKCTSRAQKAMRIALQAPPELLLCHKHGARLFSRNTTRPAEPLYVITEWDRSVPTLLLPEEYRSPTLLRRIAS